MGYSSQPGVTVFRTQTARGALPADIDTKGVAVKLTSGAMAGSRDLLVPDAEMGGGRDVPDALLGAVSYETDYAFYVRFQFIATLLKAVLGGAETVTATGLTTHTFTPSDSSALPFISIYEEISSGLERMQYTDCVVNTFHLESDANGYLTGTAGVIGVQQLMGVPALTGVEALYDNSTLTVGSNITVTYNAVDVQAKSFSLDVNNNFENDDFRLGSFFLADLTPKRREVTASVTLRPESSAMMRQALNGSSAATTAGGLTTKAPLVITVDTYADIPGSTPTTKYSLAFTLPTVIFEPYAFEPSGDDILETDVSMRAVRPIVANPIMTAVLKTDLAEIA